MLGTVVKYLNLPLLARNYNVKMSHLFTLVGSYATWAMQLNQLGGGNSGTLRQNKQLF